MIKALVTKIVRDSILDGPGCRYVIFVKGCHLRCPWCHNPETQSKKQEILTYPKFCIRCGNCAKVAPKETPEGVLPVKVDNTRFEEYIPCVESCPSGALEFAGIEYCVDELVEDMNKYRTVYTKTGGGMTISGGEPLLNKRFSLEIFRKSKSLGFHTAIDTTATIKWQILKEFLPVVDLWLIDLKHYSKSSLKTKLVIENLLKLSKIKDMKIWIRVPIIPKANDDTHSLEEIACIIRDAGEVVKQVDLLPFHPYGTDKYDALFLDYKFRNHGHLDKSVLLRAKEIFDRYLPSKFVNLGREMVHG